MPALLPELPTTRDEAFKFTSLKALAGLAFMQGRTVLGELEDLPKGVTLTPIKTISGLPETKLAQRALASEDDGWRLTVATNTQVEHPIALSFFYAAMKGPTSFAPRLEIVLEENASLFLVERHLSSAKPDLMVNVISSIRLAKGASLTHLRLNEMDIKDTHLATGVATLDERSHYQHFALTVGARLSRHELHINLGEHANSVMDGITLLAGDQHGDITSFTTHAKDDGRSRQSVRSILKDRAHGVFQGRITVAPHARNNDAGQISRALLLSSGAAMDAKPELEILNDEVACSHGATIGAIDEQAMFYLQSRGIPADESRGLLISGFVSESLATLPLCLAPEAEGVIAEWLEAHHG